jgi:hypothetical protein
MLMTYVHEAKVEVLTSHTVKHINGRTVEIANVYEASASGRLDADVIVMATARTSENELYQLLRERRLSVEAVGCVVVPRTVYEATLEGHRAARKLSGGRLRWVGTEVARDLVGQYSRS